MEVSVKDMEDSLEILWRLWSKSRILEFNIYEWGLGVGGYIEVEVNDVELRKPRSCNLVYCKDHLKMHLSP